MPRPSSGWPGRAWFYWNGNGLSWARLKTDQVGPKKLLHASSAHSLHRILQHNLVPTKRRQCSEAWNITASLRDTCSNLNIGTYDLATCMLTASDHHQLWAEHSISPRWYFHLSLHSSDMHYPRNGSTTWSATSFHVVKPATRKNKSTPRAQTSARAEPVQIQSLDDFQHFTGTSSSKDTFLI